MDKNIYSSSAFISLLETQYNQTIPMIALMTKDDAKRLERVKNGVGYIGMRTYNSIRLQLEDIPLVDYDGSYKH